VTGPPVFDGLLVLNEAIDQQILGSVILARSSGVSRPSDLPIDFPLRSALLFLANGQKRMQVPGLKGLHRIEQA